MKRLTRENDQYSCRFLGGCPAEKWIEKHTGITKITNYEHRLQRHQAFGKPNSSAYRILQGICRRRYFKHYSCSTRKEIAFTRRGYC